MKQLTKPAFKPSLITAFILLLTSFAQITLPKTFTDLLSRANMTFQSPDTLLPVPVINTHAINYEYAIQTHDKNFEVRYLIRPTDSLWHAYESNKKSLKKGDINTNPDSTFLSAFQTIILNVSGSLPDITEFDKASVKREFNADWGGTVAVQPRKEFAQNFKYCMIVALHRSHQGDAYIFYLSNTTEGFDLFVSTVFHAVKFN